MTTKFILLDAGEMKVVCDKEYSEDNFTNDLHKAKWFNSPKEVIYAKKLISGYPIAIRPVDKGFDANLFNRLQVIEI